MSSSFFCSITSEQRWANQFNQHFNIYIDNSPSIFRVPKKVSESKPEDYAPQEIGLGAYHHFQPDFDDEMESKKLEKIKKFLKPEQYNNFKTLIVDKVKELEQPIRACYNNYLDLDGNTLSWIMAIDGTYLLHLLSTASSSNRELYKDIFKLENQIPTIVLKEIRNALREVQDGDNTLNTTLFREFLGFCHAHSPLDMSSETQTNMNNITNHHLLDYLYQSMMNNWIVPDVILSPKKDAIAHSGSAIQLMSLSQNENQQLILPQSSTTTTGLSEPLIPPGVDADTLLQDSATLLANLTGLKPLMMLARLPLREGIELFNLFRKVQVDNVQEITIPSVTQLHEITNLDFKKWTEKGIGIKYDQSERVLYLPVMRLNTNSEVILSNLKAYEEALAGLGSSITFSDYLDFMCGIIDTAKDVELLKERGIVESKMDNEKIADIFNGIQRSNPSDGKIEKTIQQLNKGYDDTFRIKCWTYVKQHFIPSEASIRICVYILVILLLAFQAFCDVYGCNARWFSKKK